VVCARARIRTPRALLRLQISEKARRSSRSATRADEQENRHAANKLPLKFVDARSRSTNTQVGEAVREIFAKVINERLIEETEHLWQESHYSSKKIALRARNPGTVQLEDELAPARLPRLIKGKTSLQRRPQSFSKHFHRAVTDDADAPRAFENTAGGDAKARPRERGCFYILDGKG